MRIDRAISTPGGSKDQAAAIRKAVAQGLASKAVQCAATSAELIAQGC